MTEEVKEMNNGVSEVQSVQWFPGHMAKTRRAIQSSLKLVDIVAELIDARIPISSRNPVLKSIIGSKPKIVLMNKADMADPAETAKWVEYFKQQRTVAIPIDCKTGKGLNRLNIFVRMNSACISNWQLIPLSKVSNQLLINPLLHSFYIYCMY